MKKHLEVVEKQKSYILGMRPAFHKESLFSDGTDRFCKPSEPQPGDKVRLRFRTKKDNVDVVYLCIKDQEMRMVKEYTKGSFDYYKIIIKIGTEPISFYYKVIAGKVICYYNKGGVCWEPEDYFAFMLVPGFHTPEWAKGAVMYQIFTDRFCNGDPSNDVVDNEYVYINEGTRQITDWSRYPAVMDVREFYGGDLQGVMDKLDYLQELGIEAIYFNPLFVSPSNHKYDIQDYDSIDPHFGKIVNDGGEPLSNGNYTNVNASKYIQRVTVRENLDASNDFFAQLVEEIHSRGMKVILDGVFNHCGSFNKWMDRECIYENAEGYEKGAYVSESSPYQSFFNFFKKDSWPYNQNYDGWWGHDTLPKLNYEGSEKLYQDIMDVAAKWLKPPYNVDGWRLDVAADLGHSVEYNHEFWRDFRKRVKEINPEALILAEHYGYTKDWLQGDQWDTVMNYDAFMEPLTWFLTGMEKHSDEYRGDLLGNVEALIGAMRYHMAGFMTSSMQTAMNELSNHDHSRFLTRTNHKVGRIGTLGPEAANQDVNKGVFKEAVLIQMTWPGAPTIYYGDEAGLCGFTDPDNRRTYPWGQEDHELISYHKELIAIRRAYPVLKKGSMKFLLGGHNVLSYARFDEKEVIIVVVNNNDSQLTVEIPVWEAEVPKYGVIERVMLSAGDSYSTEKKEYQVAGGYLRVDLEKYSGVIFALEH